MIYFKWCGLKVSAGKWSMNETQAFISFRFSEE